MTTRIRTHNLGFPRMGANRELKRALESTWAGKTAETELLAVARRLRAEHWRLQQAAGIDWIPSNDFSLYDQMLDACRLVGAIPERFRALGTGLEAYFAMARGEPSGSIRAMEMTKWFDTNYHYLVSELEKGQEFHLASTKPFDEFAEALALGIRTVPVLIGPLTFLQLAKTSGAGFNRFGLMARLVPVYAEALRRLREAGAEWVQLDEPAFALDLDAAALAAARDAYAALRTAAPGLRILLATYFGGLGDNLSAVCRLPVDALHVDAVRAPAELDRWLAELPPTMALSLGVVDGRNVWKNDYDASLDLLRRAQAALGSERLLVSPSCSLLHVPHGLDREVRLDAEIKSWLAFAREKLAEVAELARLMGPQGDAEALSRNRTVAARRRRHPQVRVAAVRNRLAAVAADDLRRKNPYAVRWARQQARLRLPSLPTTTIGSFPQTADVRAARARFRKGETTAADYERFLEAETAACVRWQEEIGLDVLVHGEFERTDMVEYFGEQLAGFVFTENGWVQSYGSRCVKPPIIFGDVARPRPMTVRWSTYAQSLTLKPMKAMLTGPITILQWSFVRNDQPRRDTAWQIALALRDEVRDLEAAGLPIVQIDEPALREGLPLRRADWRAYLDWAGQAFRLASSGVRDDTQIHTHMCYCEFDDVMDDIAALDADVISIEASRSGMELLKTFATFRYPNGVGPGVWDIHSPRVPPMGEMLGLLCAAQAVIPRDQLWVNPDCGLKTRQWKEVEPALRNLVEAARAARN